LGSIAKSLLIVRIFYFFRNLILGYIIMNKKRGKNFGGFDEKSPINHSRRNDDIDERGRR